MKYIYTVALTFISFISSSQSYFGTGLSVSLPRQQMADNIGSLQSISASYMYRLPGTLNRVFIGADLGWGLYANTEKLQTFNFGSGGSTETWVYYSSYVSQAGLTGRINLINDKIISPYINGKVGYSLFYSNIFVEDPHDEDGCKPLQQKNLISDGTLMAAYGGGVMVNTGLFSKNKEKRNAWIDLSINKTSGGRLDYINTRRLIDASSPTPAAPDGKALNVRFINATTQEIHEHQVAEVYTTPLRMLDFKLNFIFRMDPACKKRCKRFK